MSKKLTRLVFRVLLLGTAAGLIWGFTGCARPVPTSAPPISPTATLERPDAYAEARKAMVTWQIEGRGVSDPAVLDAMRRLPRHLFVPDQYISAAYEDHPLPIGYGQTISQPYIVGLMSQALHVQPGQRVLEIGTGSGYQAAVLAEMGAEVYTVEIVPELAQQATQRLGDMGYKTVQVRQVDGYFGWQDHAPYDAIIVTAAPDHMPQPLAAQLREGGRLIVPIGPRARSKHSGSSRNATASCRPPISAMSPSCR